MRKYEKNNVNTKATIVKKDDRSMQEQVNELRSVVRGFVHSYNFIFGYDISSIPICESGNPKVGTFGSFKDKYSEVGELVKVRLK